jgi:hypothetical protein
VLQSRDRRERYHVQMLRKPDDVSEAIRYLVDEQGEPMAVFEG